MTIRDTMELLGARLLCGAELLDTPVYAACGSDMMSDVLAASGHKDILLTGLANPQVIRTALMLDTPCVCFVRGKPMLEETVEMARKAGICVLATELMLFEACGRLYHAGLGRTHE
ncbi:MAG: hypothetical protein FWF10_06455 [Clostridiales bacterium]|nr:hypothetical protein [Clostridiales bacterium]